MYGDVDAGLCWTDCKTYIDFLKTIPSHFQGDASEWCAKTEDERNDWLAAPENNLPANYPCHSLEDWRNFIIFVEEYNKSNPNAQLPSDFAKWHEWDILSNDTRKALVAAYNKYIEVWNDYNAVGVNQPTCETDGKVDDIDSYIKCLLSPASYPCQDCESWHNFQNYTDIYIYYQLWNSAKNEDKVKALRKYYDFQKTADGQICTECSPCDAYLDTQLPCSNCKDTFEYLNWTDTTYGASTKWLTYSQLTDYEKRQCWYSWNKFRKEAATTCVNQVNLPDDIKPKEFPLLDCWFDYVDFCMARGNGYEVYPETWVHYNAQTDDKKRELYMSLYYFTCQADGACKQCVKLPDDIMPEYFPCKNDCEEYYEYMDWCSATGRFQANNNWADYNSLDNAAKRKLYDTWNKEWLQYQGKIHACTQCVPIPTNVVPICLSFTLMGWNETDWVTYQTNCGDIAVYEDMDVLVYQLRDEIANIQTNGSSTFTPVSGRYPTFFNYSPYFYQVVYLHYNPDKTEEESANLLYEAYLENPDMNLSLLMTADTKYQAAYNNGIAYGCHEVTVNRNCSWKYPTPDVWKNYNRATYAYYKELSKSSCSTKGGCETTWCEYVSWVLDNIGQTASNIKIDSTWIYAWYAWDLMKKYPKICANYSNVGCDNTAETITSNTTCNGPCTALWYYCEDCGTNRENCKTYKSAYCTALGTYCEGMPDSFRLAWGQNDDGSYPKKTRTSDNKEITIYEAWCEIKNNSTKTDAFTALETYITSCKNILTSFKANVQTEATKYWNGNWTMPDGAGITSANKTDSIYTNYTAQFSQCCYNCSSNADGIALAGKAIMFYNTKSHMPWSWKVYFGQSTNDWYKLIMYPVSTIDAQEFHTLDEKAKECQLYLEAIVGDGKSNIGYREVVKSDYDDFTAPTWWGGYLLVVENQASATTTCSQTAMTSSTGYTRVYTVSKTDVDLKELLTWLIFDYVDSADAVGNLRLHGNFWAGVWLQATARNTGGFFLNENNGWANMSVLCGAASGSTLSSTGAPAPVKQLFATRLHLRTAIENYWTSKGTSECHVCYITWNYGNPSGLITNSTMLSSDTTIKC
jgi:hypothetical protein